MTRPPVSLRPASGTRPRTVGAHARSPCWSSGPLSCSRSSRGCLTPGSFVRLPLEGLVVVGLAVALPTRARRFVPWVVGPLLGVLVLLKLFDLGFFIAFDRPFNPVEDWSYLSIGVATVRDTFGGRDADLAVAAAVVLGLTALVVPTLAVGQLTRVAARHRRRSLRDGGRARRRLGALLGVRRRGLRRRDRIDERGASRRQTRCTPCAPTCATRLASGSLIDRKDPYLDTPAAGS